MPGTRCLKDLLGGGGGERHSQDLLLSRDAPEPAFTLMLPGLQAGDQPGPSAARVAFFNQEHRRGGPWASV